MLPSLPIECPISLQAASETSCVMASQSAVHWDTGFSTALSAVYSHVPLFYPPPAPSLGLLHKGLQTRQCPANSRCLHAVRIPLTSIVIAAPGGKLCNVVQLPVQHTHGETCVRKRSCATTSVRQSCKHIAAPSAAHIHYKRALLPSQAAADCRRSVTRLNAWANKLPLLSCPKITDLPTFQKNIGCSPAGCERKRLQ
jgi:hypothetical protein